MSILPRSWWTLLGILAGGIVFFSPSLQAETHPAERLPEGFQLRTLTDADGEHRYSLFVPRQYDPAKQWPVLMFLHGAGEKGTDGLLPLGGTLAVALERWPTAPFIAVFPQCEDLNGRALTGWLADSSDGRRAVRILDSVIHDFSVDSRRQALVGWSMGGYGAWSLAAAFPERWSAVLTLAGGAEDGTISLEGLAKARTPVWAINGDDDPLIPWTQSQQLITELNRLGGHGSFTRLHGLGHDVCQRVFANRETFNWLLQPDSIDPAQIHFNDVTPLPLRTRFYREVLVTSETIARTMSVRLGNQALEELAPDLPEMFPPASMEGDLPDIQRTFGDAENPLHVSLSDVRYRCRISRCWLHAISGARLAAEFDFAPLEMLIGQTRLESRDSQARLGPIRITIGIHAPAALKLEVQPEMQQEQLKLKLLRQNFSFADGNWYIHPPSEVQVQSKKFTSDQVVSGIVGTLYMNKQEITEQVLQAVPDLLEGVEAELRAREAPQLAKVLSPLPVLVPEISVAPSQVRTDPDGLSFLCDLQVLTRTGSSQLTPRKSLSLPLASDQTGLAAQVLFEAVTLLSEVTLNQNMAQVNVLDISESKFQQLADPQVMQQVLPDLNLSPGSQLQTILRLLNPLVLSPGNEPASERTTGLVLSSSAVALDIYGSNPGENAVPVGRIVFRLQQPIQIQLPAAGDVEAAVHVQWMDQCRVEFVRGDALQGAGVPQVNGPEFEKLFHDVWLSWAAEHGAQTFSPVVTTLGRTQVRLNTLKAEPDELDLKFKIQREQ